MGRHLGPRKKYLKRFELLGEARQRKPLEKKTVYGKRLEEKQKLKFIYDIREQQFLRYIRESLKAHGDPAVMLYKKLEFRLDNVIYRLGFASTRQAARQLVAHGHVLVNGNKVDIPSYHVEPRDEITLSSAMLANVKVREALEKRPEGLPGWLYRENHIGKVLHAPGRDEVRKDVDFNSIFEYYA